MKKQGFKLAEIAAIALVAMLSVSIVYAGSVYDRTSVTTTTSGGTGTWTANLDYANVELVRISVPAWPVIDTVTVKRVTGDAANTLTNTLMAIVCTTSGGASNFISDLVTPRYLKTGDKLVFSSHVSTGGVIWIEYLNQKH
jgi:hypothetical protein